MKIRRQSNTTRSTGTSGSRTSAKAKPTAKPKARKLTVTQKAKSVARPVKPAPAVMQLAHLLDLFPRNGIDLRDKGEYRTGQLLWTRRVESSELIFESRFCFQTEGNCVAFDIELQIPLEMKNSPVCNIYLRATDGIELVLLDALTDVLSKTFVDLGLASGRAFSVLPGQRVIVGQSKVSATEGYRSFDYLENDLVERTCRVMRMFEKAAGQEQFEVLLLNYAQRKADLVRTLNAAVSCTTGQKMVLHFADSPEQKAAAN